MLALHKMQEFCTETNDLKLRFRIDNRNVTLAPQLTSSKEELTTASKKIVEILDKIACFSGRKLSRATQRKDKFQDSRFERSGDKGEGEKKHHQSRRGKGYRKQTKLFAEVEEGKEGREGRVAEEAWKAMAVALTRTSLFDVHCQGSRSGRKHSGGCVATTTGACERTWETSCYPLCTNF